MCGSGKSIASDFYESKGYKKVYFGGVVMDEINRMGLDVTPDNEKYVRNKLRDDYGMAAMAIKSLPKIEEFYKSGNVVLDGLYSWDELVVLKEKYPELVVIAIVIDKKIRYNRLAVRDVRPFSNDDAMKRDLNEIENMAKGGPIAYADYYILNNGNLDDYNSELNRITKLIEGD
jgi:dephospho-CoA kinase